MQVDAALAQFWEKYNLKDDVIAAGVSGGADSLALVLGLHKLLSAQNKRVVALTVDHGLRAESAQEAAYVAQVMARFGIEHHILVWQGDKPRRGVEDAARKARYALLEEWCVAHGVKTLAVAHHALDQAETFFLRLQRGSGLFGLCGMLPVSQLGKMMVVRPLLACEPEDLKDYLRERQIKWVEDPSNQCEDFMRVKIRKRLPLWLRDLNLPLPRIGKTMSELARARDFIQSKTDGFIKNHARMWEDWVAMVRFDDLAAQHDELIFQVMATLIRKVGGNTYIPRAEDVERLIVRIFPQYEAIGDVRREEKKPFAGATLGGCEILLQSGKIWVIPELKTTRKMPRALWERFCELYPSYQKQKFPYKVRAVLVKNKMKVEF